MKKVSMKSNLAKIFEHFALLILALSPFRFVLELFASLIQSCLLQPRAPLRPYERAKARSDLRHVVSITHLLSTTQGAQYNRCIALTSTNATNKNTGKKIFTFPLFLSFDRFLLTSGFANQIQEHVIKKNPFLNETNFEFI